MMVLLGRLLLVLALGGAVATTWGNWQLAHGRTPTGLVARGHWFALGGLVGAFAVLEVALVTNDFSVKFVAEHHSRAMPLLFTMTGAWAGLEGSLLLWATVIGGYLAVVARRVQRNGRQNGTPDRLGAMATAVMASIAVFFVSLVLFVSPTFVQVTDRGAGAGANPLLQDNLLMAIHPPLLYLGYVGFVVPFSFAVAALWMRERGPRWVLRTQNWAVVAWSFLSAGIVIGGWWSYEVLGWGGYWAWDPVENASFLPWLVGTAYLHSAVMQARRGLLPAWSVGLVLSTFVMTLLGTFLARSGVIASVHAFSGSSLGPVLLVYLLVVFAAVAWLFVTRLRDVVAGPPLESLASKEGAFLLNNLLLAVFAAVVLIGTAYPIVVEAISNDRISVGRPFFDRFAIIISLTLLVAMLVGVAAPYRRAGLRPVWEHLRLPVQIGMAASAVAIIGFGLRAPYVIVVLVLCTTIVANAVKELVVATLQRRDHRGTLVAAGAALRARPSFFGGQLAHVGLAVLVVGIAASANLAQRATVTLQPGATVSVAGYQVTYVGPTAHKTGTYQARGAQIRLARAGMTHTVDPEFHQYANQVQPVGVPAVWTTSRGDDAYVSLLKLDESGATIHLYRYPWILLVWIGGLTMAAGGASGLLLRRLRSRSDRSALVAALRLGALGDVDVAATTAEAGEPDGGDSAGGADA
jgi:cytochrome c-type biogenesis protein CcmF